MVHSYFASVKAGFWSLKHYIDWICKDGHELPWYETCLTAFYGSLAWIVEQRSISQPVRVIAKRIVEVKEVNVNNETLICHFASLIESSINQLPETTGRPSSEYTMENMASLFMRLVDAYWKGLLMIRMVNLYALFIYRTWRTYRKT